MKRLLVGLLLLLCTAQLALGQNVPQSVLQNAQSANANGSVLGVGVNPTVNLEVTISGTITVNFETAFTQAFTTAHALMCHNRSANISSTSTTSSGMWTCSVQGLGYIRARTSGVAATPSATVKASFSSSVFTSKVVSGVEGDVVNVRSFGATGDVQEFFDGAITSGTTTLTSATANFGLSDVGLSILVVGAGAGGTTLYTSISAFISATSVTVANAASTTVTGKTITFRGTDDTSAIQAAATALPAGGGVLFIPPGIYKITDKITLKRGTTLLGSGQLISRIYQYGNTDAFYAVGADAVYLHFVDIQLFDGLGIAARTAGHGINLDGTGSFSNFTIERVYIVGFVNGINVVLGGYSDIRRTRVASCKQDGYAVSGTNSTDVNFYDTYALSCGRYGFNVDAAANTTLTGTISDSNTSAGYFVNGGNMITFNSSSAEANVGHGYHFTRTVNITMNSPRVSNAATQDGIRLEGARFVTLNSPYAANVTGYCLNALDATGPAQTYLNILVANPNYNGCVAGNYNDPSKLITVYDGGKLGIGATIPQQKVDVNGSLIIRDQGGAGQMTLSRSGAGSQIRETNDGNLLLRAFDYEWIHYSTGLDIAKLTHLGVFSLIKGTAPSSSPADMTQIWTNDWNGAGTNALFLRNEEGTVSVLATPKAYFNTANGLLVGQGLNIPHTVNKIASANVRNSHDAEVTHTGDIVYTKVKTITLTNGLLGQQRFVFDMKTSNVANTANCRIYRNGVALGTEQSDVTAAYVTKSEDLTQTWNPSDTAELWCKIDNAAQTVSARNFRIEYDDSPTVAVTSSNS